MTQKICVFFDSGFNEIVYEILYYEKPLYSFHKQIRKSFWQSKRKYIIVRFIQQYTRWEKLNIECSAKTKNIIENNYLKYKHNVKNFKPVARKPRTIFQYEINAKCWRTLIAHKEFHACFLNCKKAIHILITIQFTNETINTKTCSICFYPFWNLKCCRYSFKNPSVHSVQSLFLLQNDL